MRFPFFPRLYARAITSLFAGLFLLGANGLAESKIPKEQIQAVMDEMIFQMSGAPGMMIGIVSEDEEAFIAFGETAKVNDIKPSLDTVWAIGSVSKVFTTQILASMVVSGEVKLADPLSMYLPKGTKIPEMDGRKILLLDLATHTAGSADLIPG